MGIMAIVTVNWIVLANGGDETDASGSQWLFECIINVETTSSRGEEGGAFSDRIHVV